MIKQLNYLVEIFCIKKDLACLNRALVNFFIDHNVSEFGYIECVIPELVKSSV